MPFLFSVNGKGMDYKLLPMQIIPWLIEWWWHTKRPVERPGYKV